MPDYVGLLRTVPSPERIVSAPSRDQGMARVNDQSKFLVTPTSHNADHVPCRSANDPFRGGHCIVL